MKEVFDATEGYRGEADESVIAEYEAGIAEMEKLEEWKLERIETVELKTVKSLYELQDVIVRTHKERVLMYTTLN